MIARQLESILSRKTQKIGLSSRARNDIAERFNNLRGYNFLPKGRVKNSQHLSISQIVSCILALGTEKPGFAGLASLSLQKLQPIGAVEDAFNKAPRLSDAIEALLMDDAVITITEIYGILKLCKAQFCNFIT